MRPLSDHYTDDDFVALIDRERSHIEFKVGAGKEPLQDAIVALSNSEGGAILIGVRDDGSIKGRPLDQGTEEAINEAALTARDVGTYQIREIAVGARAVVAVEVKRRIQGFAQTSSGRVLVRRGPSNRALFGAELATFIHARAWHRFELASADLLVDDLDGDLLNELRAAMNLTDSDGLADRLAEHGLADDGTLTVTGALFLTRPEASRHLRKAAVEIRRYPDDGVDYDRREHITGPLHHQVRDATAFIMSELGLDVIVSGLYRYELPRLPEVVVREAVANAVAHRTYESDTTATIVEMRPDRVAIRSPGPLPEQVNIHNIRSAQAARNPDILSLLRRFDLAEDAGRGVDVMQDEMKEALLDPPVFEDDGIAVTATLPLRGPITSRERAWLADLERRGVIAGTDRLLIVHAARGESLTNTVARGILSTQDPGEARTALQRLRDAGLLLQHGERGSAFYTLVDSIAPPAAYRLDLRDLADLIVEAAAGRPLSNADVREITGLGRQDVLRLLRQLVRDGRLTQSGQRRGTRYRAV